MTIPDKTQARPRDFPVNGEPGYTVAGVKCYYPSAGKLQCMPLISANLQLDCMLFISSF